MARFAIKILHSTHSTYLVGLLDLGVAACLVTNSNMTKFIPLLLAMVQTAVGSTSFWLKMARHLP